MPAITFERFLDDRVMLYCGDMRAVLAELPENIYDSCVTDPPYHLLSIVKRFGADGAAPPKVRHPYGVNFEYKPSGGGTGAAFARMSRGFMGKQWDGGDLAFDPDTWRAVYRVLKPGAHLVAMGGSRTYGRLQVAIEDAGFDVRDTIAWIYGSGFPKSHDTAQSIEKLLTTGAARRPDRDLGGLPRDRFSGDIEGTLIANTGGKVELTTDEAREWAGWGTALKPAIELICLARKPLSEATVASNVLKWSTGAINIDGCRIATGDNLNGGAYAENGNRQPMAGDEREGAALGLFQPGKTADKEFAQPSGRWPANLAHDGSAEVLAAFPDSKSCDSPSDARCEGTILGGSRTQGAIYPGEDGSAARFFYTAKADSDDRIGSKHPTVKPLDLMQWLVRLVTPPRGLVLDPFAGTGTTAEAAWREGMRCELIEAEPEYQADARRRMALAMAGPEERARESIKAKNLPRDDGPLFDFFNEVAHKSDDGGP